MINRGGTNYYNIQVQIGRQTFATALIPAAVELGTRKIRNALVQSLMSGNQAVVTAGDKGHRSWWVALISAAGIAALLAA
ncbi:unnamed protein product [Didymodactylos carnosus]|uniref:Uncharacterized protein n=1 Tax=Didymodactylos carnosus TaxID=1234261 RepID=A0A815G798_9BILA|nr:unnamed protein product [Didymodactylos carnosus]CAF4192330.1 unnamed protein product [Didymodactylos carnosus]